jgi:alpha-mannosidase
MWLWEWQEGAAASVSTFRTAADLCEEFEGFVFNHNESLLYQWIEEYEPDLFQRIQRLVKAGKWHIMGGWHVQPDCNMPSGESFVRQILLGKTYFLKKFGVEPTTAINFDPFGHTRGLVQILAKGGYDSYLFHRPHALNLPRNEFVWVGYDGSEVMGTRIPAGYGSGLGQARSKIEGALPTFGDRKCNLVAWGVGNHGGGPSRKDIQDINDLVAATTDFDIVHSTPEAYFGQLNEERADLPRVERDLNPWAVGCYTSQVRIKQKHRLLENELYSTEKMVSGAAFQGLMSYPAKDLREAMYDLATCEFHDILPGSSIQQVEDAAIRMLDHGLEILSRIKARAFFALSSGEPKANEGEIPILVYNPHPFKVTMPVECEFMMEDQNWSDSFTLTPVYKDGKPLPSQNIEEDSNVNLDWRKRVVFVAELEPSCMNRFHCILNRVPKRPEPAAEISGDTLTFKTPDLVVVINTQTGLMDKYAVGGMDYIGENAFQPIVMQDDEDSWGMNVTGFRREEGRFTLMSPEEGTAFSGVTARALPSVRVIEDGPVWTVVEAIFEYGSSAACQQYLLPKSGTVVEVRTRVHWNEKTRLLKLSIPMPTGDYRYLGQVAYGVNELPSNGDESVAQKWVAVAAAAGSRALTCINDGIYGSDFSEDGLRLTLLRSPAYSGHPIGERPIVPQDRYLPRIDQGERLYRFWLNAGPAEDRLARIDREALVRNEKPFALSFFPHGGGKEVKPFLTLSDDVVQVTATKQSEDGKALVVRLFEPTGTPRCTTLSLPFANVHFDISLKPFEIKTLRIDLMTGKLTETDLLERPT